MHSLSNEANDLLTAARKGDKQRLLQLIIEGANVNANLGYWDAAPLINSVAQACDTEIVQLLVSKGADIFQLDSLGPRAIEIAKEYKKNETVTYLERTMREIANKVVQKASDNVRLTS